MSAFILDTNASKTQVNNYYESFDFLPTSTTNQILKHNHYSLSYNQKYEQAKWLLIKKSYVSSGDFNKYNFIADSIVKTSSADWWNYKKSG